VAAGPLSNTVHTLPAGVVSAAVTNREAGSTTVDQTSRNAFWPSRF